jgi:transcriptional regulator with XRE-family HTH domain
MSKVVISFGEYIRSLRENEGLPIRKIAAQLDIDPSLLGKIERDERQPTREQIASIAKIFKQDEKYLTQQFLSDQFAYRIIEENSDISILRVAEDKVKYFTQKKENNLK